MSLRGTIAGGLRRRWLNVVAAYAAAAVGMALVLELARTPTPGAS